MNLTQAFLLGIVQGVAEFLPISSSGHLAVAQSLFGITEPTLAFDVFLHFVSLIAIVIFFWKRIMKITFQELVFLGIGTIPAVFVGVFLENFIDHLFQSLWIVGGMLMVTGGINFLSDYLLHQDDRPHPLRWLKRIVTGKPEKLTAVRAFIIGVFQSFALIPGISRSGTTLLGSLTQKLEKMEAFNIAFLLAIPAIAGATGLQMLKIFEGSTQPVALNLMLMGGLSTFITSFLSLRLLKNLVEKSKLNFFGWYCLTVGAGVCLLGLFS